MRSPQIESRQAVPTWQGSPAASVEIVLRVRLVGGDRLDVAYENAEAVIETPPPSTRSPRLDETPVPYALGMETDSLCCTAAESPP